MDKFAKVKVVDKQDLVRVPISSKDKPEIASEFEEKWQELVDLAARIIGVPAGLIMRLLDQEIEVFASSNTDNNPYEPGEKVDLGYGLYCETVVGKRKGLLVPDALADEDWKDNPDVKLNMVSYYGVPIKWPDGEVFGTFCVLDNKENSYTEDQRTLLIKFKELVERDLDILYKQKESLNSLAYKEMQIQEMRHRFKNQLNMLVSYIDLHRINKESESHAGSDHFAVDMQGRIRALYKLHEILTSPDVDSNTPLSGHLEQIVEKIIAGAFIDIEVEVSGSELYLEENLLVSISMIVNELVTNSIKYAFTGVENPKITIECRDKEKEMVVSYRDNGANESVSEKNTKGLGTMIIKGVAAQISAVTRRYFDDGFHFDLIIPKES